MQTREFQCKSKGLRLDGLLHQPDEPQTAARPTIVVASGMHGLKEWVPSRFAPFFVAAGFNCVGFDYRGFGTSEGERGQMLPNEEVWDTLSVLDCIRELPGVDPDRIGIIGWGLGAGIAIEAAALDPRVRAVCAANGAGDYGRAMRASVTPEEWLAWKQRVEEDRVQRIRTGVSARVPNRFITKPVTGGVRVSRQFEADLKALGQNAETEFTIESSDAYIAFRPENTIAHVAPRPVLILHGERNWHYVVDEAHALYDKARQPKELAIIRNGQHLEMIHPDNPEQARTMAIVVDWFKRGLQ